MKLTASEKAVELIITYCNKHNIDFEKLNNQTISFKKVTDTLRSYCRGVMQAD